MGITKKYINEYSGQRLNYVAFPMGGIGAGMLCLEGTGALSHVSVRNKPEIANEPMIFSALCIKGARKIARVLEGPVPSWKIFSPRGADSVIGAGNGLHGKNYGLPRFTSSTFKSFFPYGEIELKDEKIPLDVRIKGWSPFIPNDSYNSSLPVAGLEYKFENNTENVIEAVYSFNSINFIKQAQDLFLSNSSDKVLPIKNGFVLYQPAEKDKPWEEGSFCVVTDDDDATIDYAWFRGGWFDPLTMLWKTIEEGKYTSNHPIKDKQPSPGASIFVPFKLKPGESKVIKIMMSWYVPNSNLRFGYDEEEVDNTCCSCNCNNDENIKNKPKYKPWYSEQFKDIYQITDYWRKNYEELNNKSRIFSDCFYDTTLPDKVVEAVAANLSIIKSPTILRQTDGRLWGWEGCCNSKGCCTGSCTHVWNYAQSIPHLFPQLERTLRKTEFNECQDENGHQTFRASLPIRSTDHKFYAASDGQLGGIMKVYRDWKISGEFEWLKEIWPKVKASLKYCIKTWDPNEKGIIEEPHHNTYDIEFWGPDGMCTSFYLGALKAAYLMAQALCEEYEVYDNIYKKGKKYMEETLFNGEYFEQEIKWTGLNTKVDIDEENRITINDQDYSEEVKALILEEGPKYQYGTGCLSDGVLGAWMALVCGIGEILDKDKVISHLLSIHKYNLKKDLSEHTNPQRPGYAVGKEGGLLLCTWPNGGKPSLPFVYSDEVWTGIEYQVASHLMMMGYVEEGLEIVEICRDRYDGTRRNPFNEYECGHWYARAMSSNGMIQGLTGIRYDAVDKILFIDPTIKGDFKSFLSTETGFAIVGIKDDNPFIEVKLGHIEVKTIQF